MRKITLNYDDSSGVITDNQGNILATHYGLNGHDAQIGLSVDDLISLKKADFTVEEMAELKRQNLLAY